MALNAISNYAANVAHRYLQASDVQATSSLAKLSSGTRVLSARDDAASLAIGSRLNADLGAQNIAEFADFLGQRYGYGDGIWNLTDTPIDLHQNTARRYGGNMHLFLMLVNIAEMGVKSGSELTLIVPAPPGLLRKGEAALVVYRDRRHVFRRGYIDRTGDRCTFILRDRVGSCGEP